MTHTTNHSRAAAETRAHYERLERDARGRWMPEERFEYLQRYFSDPVFKAEQDAEREAKQQRISIEWDAVQVRAHARANRDDEPGFVSAFRRRVATYARANQDYHLLKTARISEEEALQIIADLDRERNA